MLFYSNGYSQNKACFTCLKSPADISCINNGHKVLEGEEFSSALVPELENIMDLSFNHLRSAMTMRAAIKERMQSTIHSLNRFADELKNKVSIIFNFITITFISYRSIL